MSWDPYIDNLIGHSAESCDSACIIGQDGAPWTTNAHPKALKIEANEAVQIANVMKSKDCTTFQMNGVRLGGKKYQFLREEDGVVLAKLKDNGALTLQTTKTGIVIGHCAEGKTQGNVNKAVDTIAKYLVDLNM